jgi:putative intracellular protease/amidase
MNISRCFSVGMSFALLAVGAAPASEAAPAKALRVALYDAEGSFGRGVPRVSELLGRETGIKVVTVKPADIEAGALDGMDVVIFTGGSGSKQAGALGEAGRVKVREFIERGGGYVGICAGSYLACSGFSWGVKVLDAKTASPKWRRGAGTVKLEFTARGREIFGGPEGLFDVRYVNGPILVPAGEAALPDFEPLAFFRTELAENDTPKGLMVNTPAIVAGTCGQGRVICSSPHPEQTEGLEHFVARAVRWAGAKGSEDLPE